MAKTRVDIILDTDKQDQVTTKVLKILAVDDTDMNIALLGRFIQKQGHK